MKLTEAGITFLINQEFTTIEIIDKSSNITFCRIKLNPEQLSKALSRLGHTPCEVEVNGLDKVGKTMEHKAYEFEVPNDINERREFLSEVVKETLPEGWISDNYFGSQDTFFTKDGKQMARTTIRRWV